MTRPILGEPTAAAGVEGRQVPYTDGSVRIGRNDVLSVEAEIDAVDAPSLSADHRRTDCAQTLDIPELD